MTSTTTSSARGSTASSTWWASRRRRSAPIPPPARPRSCKRSSAASSPRNAGAPVWGAGGGVGRPRLFRLHQVADQASDLSVPHVEDIAEDQVQEPPIILGGSHGSLRHHDIVG